jgi:hypothetical protein
MSRFIRLCPAPARFVIATVLALPVSHAHASERVPPAPQAAPAAAQPAASARASVASSTIKTSDRAVLTIEIDAPPGWKPDAVSIESALPEGWNVLSTRPAKSATVDTAERTTLTYELEPFLPGTAEIKPVTITLRQAVKPVTTPSQSKPSAPAPASDTPSAQPITVTTAAIKIEVVSVLPEGTGKDDLAEIKGVVDAKTPTNWWLIGGVAAGSVAVIALAAWLIARQRRIALTRVVTRPAHEIALERLDQLVAKQLLAPGRERFKAFFDEASAILREYIEDRFHLRAPERTTEEFLRDARGSTLLSDNDVDALGRFLNQCDLIKFAKHTPSTDDGDRAAGIVREFIIKTRAPEATVIIEGPGAVTPRLRATAEVSDGTAPPPPVAPQREAA